MQYCGSLPSLADNSFGLGVCAGLALLIFDSGHNISIYDLNS
jgi:hypothetical protein